VPYRKSVLADDHLRHMRRRWAGPGPREEKRTIPVGLGHFVADDLESALPLVEQQTDPEHDRTTICCASQGFHSSKGGWIYYFRDET
jgi:hypothetical protein